MQEEDLSVLEYIIRSIVGFPDEVKVARTTDEMGVLLSVSVNSEDMGKLIGREGNTAKAIRTIIRVVGMKNNARVNIKILEPAGRSESQYENRPFKRPLEEL